MVKSASINSRIEPHLKAHAEAIFAELGLSTSDAITLFYKQVSLHNGLPFEVRLPSDATANAIEELEAGEVASYESFSQVVDGVNADD